MFLKEESLRVKSLAAFVQLYIAWEIEYKKDTLRAAGRNSNGTSSEIKLKTVSEPQKLIMKTEDIILKAYGQDITHIYRLRL